MPTVKSWHAIMEANDSKKRILSWFRKMRSFLFALFLLSGSLFAQCELITSSPIPLFWDANTEVNMDHYRVFRADSSTSTPALLHTVSQSADPISSSDPNPLSLGYYTVTAVNVDGLESSPSNVLCVSMGILSPPSTPVDFTVVANFSTALVISNLNRYEVGANGISSGELVYNDRTYTYFSVPTFIQGEAYLITLNNDKHSTASSFLTFDINRQATVYVAHDSRITVKPDWLLNFIPVGEPVIIAGGTHDLFSLVFPAGTVVLGGNKLPTTSGGSFSMYGVIIK